MSIESLVPILGLAFLFISFLIGIVGLAVIGFAIWVGISVGIDHWQCHRARKRSMATMMPADEIRARRLERSVKARQETIKTANS